MTTDDKLKELAANCKRQFVDRIYYAGNPLGNFMAMIFHTDDGPWMCEYRFSYCASPEPFDPNDVKHWYRVTMQDQSPEALVKMREVFDKLLPTMHEKYGSSDIAVIQLWSNDPKYVIELGMREWINIKVDNHAERYVREQIERGKL